MIRNDCKTSSSNFNRFLRVGLGLSTFKASANGENSISNKALSRVDFLTFERRIFLLSVLCMGVNWRLASSILMSFSRRLGEPMLTTSRRVSLNTWLARITSATEESFMSYTRMLDSASTRLRCGGRLILRQADSDNFWLVLL